MRLQSDSCCRYLWVPRCFIRRLNGHDARRLDELNSIRSSEEESRYRLFGGCPYEALSRDARTAAGTSMATKRSAEKR